MTPSLSVLIPSKGRASLGKTLSSVHGQLEAGDELIVDVNDDSPWGNRARNRMMPRAKGAFLLFIDDDDIYYPDALRYVRRAVTPGERAVHIFRMRYPNGKVLWSIPNVVENNVSTQMIAVPNLELGRWGERYAGDFDFIEETVLLSGCEPVFHEEHLVRIGHDQGTPSV